MQDWNLNLKPLYKPLSTVAERFLHLLASTVKNTFCSDYFLNFEVIVFQQKLFEVVTSELFSFKLVPFFKNSQVFTDLVLVAEVLVLIGFKSRAS